MEIILLDTKKKNLGRKPIITQKQKAVEMFDGFHPNPLHSTF